MTPEEMKEYKRLYYIKNKEKWREYFRLYDIKNKEKKNEYNKEYSQTENGKKLRRITQWKRTGVICEDFNILYNTYINTKNCDWCNKDFTKKRYIEHNHSSGEVRGIVCNSCNMKIYWKDKRFQSVMKDLRKDL